MSSTPPIPVISSASIKNIDVVTATVITRVVVHVISVLGVIDALFAAVEYALPNKSAFPNVFDKDNWKWLESPSYFLTKKLSKDRHSTVKIWSIVLALLQGTFAAKKTNKSSFFIARCSMWTIKNARCHRKCFKDLICHYNNPIDFSDKIISYTYNR